MSRRLVEVAWGESKPRVLPLLMSLVYALVVRLNVAAWREQDQFFLERDPQLAYPAHPSTVSNTHLVLTGCVLPFVLIFALAARAHTRVGPDAAVVWLTHQSFALGNALLVAMGTFNAGKAFVGRLRPNFFAACDYKGYAAALAEFQEVGASSALFAAYLAATEPGAVGDRADILFGTHGQFTAAGALRLARQLEPFDPLWFEEPCPPDMPEEMAKVAAGTSIPVATGERLCSKFEFARVLDLGAAAILQPDLGRAGGILEGKKIAAMAETRYVQVAPHLYCGPVVAAANIQLATSIPNFLIVYIGAFI